jgi:hypothetical protein
MTSNRRYLDFSCKNSTYCDVKTLTRIRSHMDTVGIGLAQWIRIRFEVKSWISGSRSALKPMRIHDTALVFYLTCEGGGPREPLEKKADPFVSASTDRQLSGWNHVSILINKTSQLPMEQAMQVAKVCVETSVADLDTVGSASILPNPD